MSTVTLSPESKQALAQAVAKVAVMDRQFTKLHDPFQKFYKGLEGILRHETNEDELTLYRPRLAKVGDQIDECLETVRQAQELLATVRSDADLMEAKFGHVEELVRKVAATRQVLARYATQARELDARVDQALADVRKDIVSAEADLGALQAQTRTLMKSIALVDAAAPKLEQVARKAWDRRDQKALTEARVKLIDFLKSGGAVKAMRPRIEAFAKAYPDLDRERKAELQWLRDDVERAEDSLERVAKSVRELVALGQVPQEEKDAAPAPLKISADETAKVLKAFGLPIDDTDKRTKARKVLAARSVDQWPRELARLYGVRESELKGKLSSVQRLPFVKPLTLIDI